MLSTDLASCFQGLQLKINTALFPALFHPVARLVLLYFGRNRLATVGCNRNITVTTKADRKSPSKCQLKKRKQEKKTEDDKRFFKAMNCFNIQEDIVKTCIQHRLNRIIYTLPFHPSRHLDQMKQRWFISFCPFSSSQPRHGLVLFRLFSQELLTRMAVLLEESHL